MKKFNIKPPRRKIKKWLYKPANNHKYTNLIKNITSTQPYQIFVSDFTYLKYHGQNAYLATIEDIFTREIISAEISMKHDTNLIIKTIQQALQHSVPQIFHSDQGSEFMSQSVTTYLKNHNIKVSVSDKGSPWQNGYQESFYGRFKTENGDINRFETLGELVEEIYSYIHYYNNFRIHTSLKMPPIKFKTKFLLSQNQP